MIKLAASKPYDKNLPLSVQLSDNKESSLARNQVITLEVDVTGSKCVVGWKLEDFYEDDDGGPLRDDEEFVASRECRILCHYWSCDSNSFVTVKKGIAKAKTALEKLVQKRLPGCKVQLSSNSGANLPSDTRARYNYILGCLKATVTI